MLHYIRQISWMEDLTITEEMEEEMAGGRKGRQPNPDISRIVVKNRFGTVTAPLQYTAPHRTALRSQLMEISLIELCTCVRHF